mmetsp:Transcript_38016/g.104559  ORF Transcript_38016/g.104559 Transcript_38016/m.104559 type:complete len:312 (-) Transcript_38016:174-1109(-)
MATAAPRPVGSFSVSPIGFGEWPLSDSIRPSEADAVSQLHRALSGGVDFIDTADAYCIDETEKHHGEWLVAKALASYPGDASRVVVATKGGHKRTDGDWILCRHADYLRRAIAESKAALGGGQIALWQLHCVDPLEDACGTQWTVEGVLQPAVEAVAAGDVKHIGLSNCTCEQVEAALKVLPPGVLAFVQNPYPFHDLEARAAQHPVIELCHANGIAFLPWGVLGGGKRRGKYGPDVRKDVELSGRFPILNSVAKEKGTTPEAVILAWMLHRWPNLVHIVGARSARSLDSSLSAAAIDLTAEQVEAIEADC